MNDKEFAGKTAVVSGGAQGIGRAVAERLVAGGANVTIWDADGARADATAAEIGCDAIQLDVTDADACAEAAAKSAASGLHLAVFSAGIAGSNAPLSQYPVAEFHKIVDVNLNGIFHCCRAVVPFMEKAGYGRIVNIASVAGKEGNPNASAYSASKAGVIGLTKSLGKELAGQNIAVNCITPAAARTAIFDQMSEEHIAFMLSKIPRGRFVEVGEVAAMILWLLSEENSFTTAGVFDLSGGRATY
ncbi:SDR family NAD(P)-dependent oxidoreductase [Algicella marina]|uniref:SDR family oxidoreductase n=1 Tax=Algicella marina TaxID=2683284 RepID=A0A6P1T1B2_9RHOB|nr:SDR family NAD(P)-dependent oxidoreductase [Algicella marina]QHQ35531.1 SDR family oxidoreductase [Algicella marina]